MTIDFIIPYRDRAFDRVKNCIDSILSQSIPPNRIIFVDYGSSQNNKTAVSEYLINLALVDYIYSYSQGHLWNRSHALNIGIRKSNADFIIMADVDIIYPKDFLPVVIDNISKTSDKIYHYKTIYLEEGELPEKSLEFYKNNRKISGDTARGLAIYPRLKLTEIRGFDEFYCIWGEEDIELSLRVKEKFNLEEHWIEEVLTYHQWHISANKLPLGWAEVIIKHKNIGPKKPSFGDVLNNKDRVLLDYIKKENLDMFEPFVFTFPFEMSYTFLGKKIDNLESKRGIMIELTKADLFEKDSLASKLLSFINNIFEFFKLGYRVTDIDTHYDKKLPFENVVAYLFFLILNMDHNKYDYYIFDLDLENKASIYFMRK